MSTRCATPKRWPLRYTQLSAFCAATVASQVSAGVRQLSQLPQGWPGPLAAYSSPKLASSTRSEEHTSELQSLMRISYAVFCLQKKNPTTNELTNRYVSIKTT